MTSIDTPEFLAKIPGCLNTTQRSTVFPKEEEAGQLIIQYQIVNPDYIHSYSFIETAHVFIYSQ